jgi:cytochrome P450
MTATAASPEIYYDPYDQTIDDDPYPVFKRMRDEAPLYRNERYDFWALSRFADVKQCETDWPTYSSARGAALELIQSGAEMPPGNIVFEDPPSHHAHRGMLRRMFAPRRIAELEPQIRALCVDALDRCTGTGRFDFVADLGAQMPMRVIGLLLGVPEKQQQALRDRVNAGLQLKAGVEPRFPDLTFGMSDYVRWRLRHPSDDIITELSQATFVDGDAVSRRLTEQELVNYVAIVAAAGNETTTRLIGWAGYTLAHHPDQRAELAANPSLIPNAIEELLRYESPSPVQARYVISDVEWYGTMVPAGSAMLLLTASANRDERAFPDGDRFDVHRQIERHVAFGHGIHFCLGAALARLEGRIALEEIVRRFPVWELDQPNLERFYTSTVRGWHRLPTFI